MTPEALRTALAAVVVEGRSAETRVEWAEGNLDAAGALVERARTELEQAQAHLTALEEARRDLEAALEPEPASEGHEAPPEGRIVAGADIDLGAGVVR